MRPTVDLGYWPNIRGRINVSRIGHPPAAVNVPVGFYCVTCSELMQHLESPVSKQLSPD